MEVVLYKKDTKQYSTCISSGLDLNFKVSVVEICSNWETRKGSNDKLRKN